MKRCDHFFCYDCLKDILAYSKKDKVLKQLASREKTLKCPLCREGFLLQLDKLKKKEKDLTDEEKLIKRRERIIRLV